MASKVFLVRIPDSNSQQIISQDITKVYYGELEFYNSELDLQMDIAILYPDSRNFIVKCVDNELEAANIVIRKYLQREDIRTKKTIIPNTHFMLIY